MSLYSLRDIEPSLQRKSWWAILFILPVARRLALFFINRTSITPNTITLGSFIFIIGAVFAFLSGASAGLIAGAVLFELNYLFDCVDGTVARVKKLGTPLGAYLDPMLDRLRIVLLTLALAWGQYLTTSDINVVLLAFLYLGLNNLILLTRSAQEKVLSGLSTGSSMGVDFAKSTSNSGIVSWWFRKTADRNIMPYYHDIELDALVFVVGPLCDAVVPCFMAANILAMILLFVLNAIFLRSLTKWKETL
jgi:phosphatidylglycerophosphate synthase